MIRLTNILKARVERVWTPAISYSSKLELGVIPEQIIEARLNGDWFTYVFCHRRPFRWRAFSRIAGELRDEEYWPWFRRVWEDAEFPSTNKALIIKLMLKGPQNLRQLMMTDGERSALLNLPHSLKIYRGCHTRRYMRGLSWTLSQERALWFALRSFRSTGIIVEGGCSKSNIIAYLNARQEEEIVIRPDDVRIARWWRVHSENNRA